jgi:hypothetical protein
MYGIQYLYRYTVSRDWALFAKKDPSAETEAVAPRARPRRGPPAAWLHNGRDPQNLLCRHVRLRCADRRGGNPGDRHHRRHNGLLRIIGKGNKERLVPLPEPMPSSLRRLWKIHKNPRGLFSTRAATNPVGRGTLNRTFTAAAQAAGIGSATPHKPAAPICDTAA